MKFQLKNIRPSRFLKPGRSIILSLTLTSCMVVGPDYVAPKLATPPQWTETKATDKILQLQTWWQNFHDPLLNQLIQQAITSNLEIKIAESRIRASRLDYTATIAAALPSFSTHSSASRRLNSSSSSGSSGVGSGFGVGNQLINIFQLGFDAVWEIDLFGGVQRALEAAEANIDAEEESRRDRLVTLLGEVTRHYIELRMNQQLREITLASLQNQQESLDLIRVRQRAGLISNLDIAQNEAELATIRSQLPQYETGIKQAIHALALLLGQTPDKLTANLIAKGALPITDNLGVADLPSELLRRRPDIRWAERKLAISHAEIGIAVTELYPKINLSAFLGLQNSHITGFTPLGKSWSVASTLTMPIFNWGRLQTNIQIKKALNEQALFNYQQTLLTAIKEVEDALVALLQERQRAESLMRTLKAQQLVLTLANARYKQGLSNYLEVLEAQKSIYTAQQAILMGQAQQSLQAVALCKALGGGWQVQGNLVQKPELKDFLKVGE